MKQYLRHWLCWMLPLPALLAGWPALAHDFFVATNGGDANPGTQAKPFAPLERARSAVGAVKAQGGLAGVTKVVVRGGHLFPAGDVRADAKRLRHGRGPSRLLRRRRAAGRARSEE